MTEDAYGLPARDLDEAVDAVGADWDRLDGMRLFFTGGTGFVGTWMMAVLLRAVDQGRLGAGVALLSRDVDSFRHRNPKIADHRAVATLQGDILLTDLEMRGCTHLIAAASETSAQAWKRDAARSFDAVVQGARRTIDAARAAGMRRSLVVSSGAVAGPFPDGVAAASEDRLFGLDLRSPKASYALGKQVAEHLFALSGLDHTVARLWAFQGPLLPLDGHFAIGNFLRDAVRGNPIRILGDGTAIRSYQYASDMAAWCWRLLASGGPGTICNVGGDERVTIRALAELCDELLGGGGVEVLGAPTGAPVDAYVPDLSRGFAMGLRNRVSLAEGLQRFASWFGNRPFP